MIEQVLNNLPTILTLIAICMGIYIPYKLNRRIDQIWNYFEPMFKKSMGIIGEKSGYEKQVKKAEKMVMNDLMTSQFPEVDLIMSALSGETKEYIEANPHVIPALIQRYAPMIKQLAGTFGNAKKQIDAWDI